MRTISTTRDGARIYSRCLLACYDFLIYRVLSPYVWRCDPRHFLELYQRNMSGNHADVGVGTGYFLNQCSYKPGAVRIGLFDLQPNCLRYTAARLARFQPETFECDALEPIPFTGKRFSSIGLGGILHCIPGDLTEKGIVFDAITSLMEPTSRVFGYTILNQGVRKTLFSRIVFFLLHRMKVINGASDSAAQLHVELNKRFKSVDVRVVGCIALFNAGDSLLSHGAI
ncbi:MAG: hypothetical protein B0W54_04300 [Cellvibrio sp. 79]|nr:MAG: hypothetical protein B0W54_04300 [Cellvibrio sp. 79]